MASANSGLQITNLDFGSIKNSLKSFLQQQDTFKDYNFDGSSLSILLDLLAYNTQYNAYYLNMVANEMFMDSALQRASVVSQAKLLNYVPHSAVAPIATVNVTVYGVETSSLTIPKYTTFVSESVNGVNYNFVTNDSTTVGVTANTAVFENLSIYQGIPSTYSYVYNSTENPKAIFTLNDLNIDTGTLSVTVQESSSNLFYETYNQTSNYLSLTPSSRVYFLQEGMDGYYQKFK